MLARGGCCHGGAGAGATVPPRPRLPGEAAPAGGGRRDLRPVGPGAARSPARGRRERGSRAASLRGSGARPPSGASHGRVPAAHLPGAARRALGEAVEGAAVETPALPDLAKGWFLLAKVGIPVLVWKGRVCILFPSYLLFAP